MNLDTIRKIEPFISPNKFCRLEEKPMDTIGKQHTFLGVSKFLGTQEYNMYIFLGTSTDKGN
jgi:hypothetical protein